MTSSQQNWAVVGLHKVAADGDAEDLDWIQIGIEDRHKLWGGGTSNRRRTEEQTARGGINGSVGHTGARGNGERYEHGVSNREQASGGPDILRHRTDNLSISNCRYVTLSKLFLLLHKHNVSTLATAVLTSAEPNDAIWTERGLQPLMREVSGDGIRGRPARF